MAPMLHIHNRKSEVKGNLRGEIPQKGKATARGIELTREVTLFAEVHHTTVARRSKVQRI